MVRYLKPLLPVVLLLLLAVVSVGAQSIQIFDEYGVGPRDVAMGGSYVGVADDFAAAFYNAAGLTQQEFTHVTFGYKYIGPEVKLKLKGYSDDYFTKDYPDSHLALIGLNLDLYVPRFWDNEFLKRFHLGLAFAISNYVHSYTNYWDPHTPYFFRYHDRPIALLSLYLAGAMRIFDWLSVGGGVVVSPSTTHVDARVETHVYLPEGNNKNTQGLVNRSHSTVSPQVGLLFRVPLYGLADRIRIGVSWHDRVQVIDGKGQALNRMIVHFPDGTTMEPVPIQKVPVKSMTGYNPQKLTLGLSAKPYPGGLIAADLIWREWSKWENYFFLRPDPPFKDTIEVRLGFEQRFLTDWEPLPAVALRAGWYYQPSPTPQQNGEYNLLDNDKHVYSGGLGLQLGKILGILKTPVNLDLAVQVHQLMEKTINNNQDPDYPWMQTGGFIYSGAVAFEFYF